MKRHGTRGPAGVLLALTAACGLMLTGCSADRDSGARKADTSYDGGGGGGGKAPLPAPDGTGRYEGGEREGEQESRDVAPEPDHLSTFALDVDTASYGYARRALDEGRLPDPSTVRPEEFVNSFRQDYPRPDGDGFTVTVDGARTDQEDWSLVRVGLATRTAESDDERPPAALTFVIDISGSMAEPGRLDLAQEALGTMTGRAARRRLGRTRHLQRRGGDRAADDPARRQPGRDPRRDRQSGADRLHQPRRRCGDRVRDRRGGAP